MDLEAIPGLSDDENTEIDSMNEEFSGHQNEQEDADDCDSVNLDRSVQDREEEALVREYFDGSPCCALGPKKGPCWIRGGREKFVQARQESLDLEKKEVDLIVLATLPAFRSFTHEAMTLLSHMKLCEHLSSTIMGVCKSVNLLFYSFMQLVLEG